MKQVLYDRHYVLACYCFCVPWWAVLILSIIYMIMTDVHQKIIINPFGRYGWCHASEWACQIITRTVKINKSIKLPMLTAELKLGTLVQYWLHSQEGYIIIITYCVYIRTESTTGEGLNVTFIILQMTCVGMCIEKQICFYT